jgi:hypothetical protein
LAVSKWCGGHDNGTVAFIPHHFEVPSAAGSAVATIRDSFGELAFLLESREPKMGNRESEKAELILHQSSIPVKSKPKRKTQKPKKRKGQANIKTPELKVDLFDENEK